MPASPILYAINAIMKKCYPALKTNHPIEIIVYFILA